MDILHVSYEWPPNCGGGGRVAQTLADRQRADHDVSVIAGDGDGLLSFPLRTFGDVRDRLATDPPDVVHGHFSIPSSLALPRLTDRYDVPLLITTMGTDIHNPVRYQRVRPLLDRANRHVLGRADAVIAPSTALQERVAELDVDADVIPHGIPADGDWSPQRRHDPLRVLTVGRLAPGKGIETAIDAVQRLREDVPAVHRVVGDGARAPAVSERADRHEWLSWLGWIEAVQPHYEWADVFLLPSQWEAFGLVYLEALRAGVPVVATPCGGPEDIVDDGVGVIASSRPDALALALRSIASEYREYQRATEGYVAEQFSAAEMTAQYHRQYQTLIHDSQPVLRTR